MNQRSKSRRGIVTALISVFLLGLVLRPSNDGDQASAQTKPAMLTTKAISKPPVLAFYFMWYSSHTWCTCQMTDLPSIKYDSSKIATIDRQIRDASSAGINGFISSWWGPGDPTDKNLTSLLTRSSVLENQGGPHFASSIYFESDSPRLQGETNIVSGLRYLQQHDTKNSYFFHWHGKPVVFFWNPLGNGRTLAEWADIRAQVDPGHHQVWSAEGVDTNLLSVFDGLHLFSAGYWGLQSGTMPAVDQGFRTKIDDYNAANKTHKIWAAGVEPGYNDTRVPGRQGTYIIPRNGGQTYKASWSAALSSAPDWITITSYNEWFEGAMVEPSQSYGRLYLNLTRHYAMGKN